MIKSLLRQGEMAVLLAVALVILPLLLFLPPWLPMLALHRRIASMDCRIGEG